MTATYPRLDLPLLGDPEWITRPDGTRLHARRVGEGPDVLLAHGFMGTRGTMIPLTQRFQADGRVVFSYHHGTYRHGHGPFTHGHGSLVGLCDHNCPDCHCSCWDSRSHGHLR